MLNGIDVSKHNDTVDWGKVKASGVQFAMIRTGFGKNSWQEDELFEQNYAGAKAAGIPVGAYHYSYAQTVEDAKAEAQFFLNIIRGKQFEYPVVFDIEDPSQANLGKDLLTQIALTFCSTVESAGYYTMLYANLDWVTNKLDMSVLGRFDLWLAKWGTDAGYKGNYGIWQYINSAAVNGISGVVDANISYKDYATMIKAMGINGFPKPQDAPPRKIVRKMLAPGKTNVRNSPDLKARVVKVIPKGGWELEVFADRVGANKDFYQLTNKTEYVHKTAFGE